MKRLLVAGTVVMLAMGGCGSRLEARFAEPSATLEPTDSGRPLWDGFPPPEASGEISVAEFNEFLEASDPASIRSALREALVFLYPGGSDPEAATTSLVLESNPETGQEAVVTVTADGLLDDSVRAVRYELVFERQADGTWRLSSASWAQRCAPRRGHQDFTPELCI
ncbi:MAG: hypothetical protein ACRDGU_07390 [Actinomycetota bacterium]